MYFFLNILSTCKVLLEYLRTVAPYLEIRELVLQLKVR